MVLNTIFNNISVISWRSVLLESGVSPENHRPAASHVFSLFILYLWYIFIFEEIGKHCHYESWILFGFACGLCISKWKNETILLTLFQYCMTCITESSGDKRNTT